MAYGVRKLRKIQFGREATAGTAVPATEIWRGPANIPEDNRTIVFAEEDVGRLTPGLRTYTPLHEALLTLEATEATYQHLPHIFEGGIDGETPTQDGAGTDYIRIYDIGASGNAAKAYTWEGGDNADAGEIEYGFVEEFVLSGKFGEAVMLESARWRGRQYTDTTFTAGLTLDTLEEILFNKGKLYIDAVGSGFGATQKTGVLTAFKLTVDTGWRMIPVGDGSLYYASIKNVGPMVSLELTIEHDDTIAVAERAAFRAQTTRAIRLIFEGSTVATPGTTYSKQTLILDVAGRYETFGVLDDQDGDNIVVATLRGGYDSTLATMAKITIVNEVAAL